MDITTQQQIAEPKLFKTVNSRMAGSMPVWKPKSKDLVSSLQNPQAQISKTHLPAKKDEGMGFADFIDMVNPLQHIPVVSSVYREITNDSIKPPARFMGGAIYGGPIGAASSMVNIVLEEETGADIGGHVMNAVKRKPDTREIASAFASEPKKISSPSQLIEPAADTAESIAWNSKRVLPETPEHTASSFDSTMPAPAHKPRIVEHAPLNYKLPAMDDVKEIKFTPMNMARAHKAYSFNS